MHLVKRYRLPALFMPLYPHVLATFDGNFTMALNNFGTTNKAIYIPCYFPDAATLFSISFYAGNGTGNYDLGLYDRDCSARLFSTGSTAMTAAGGKTLTFTNDYRVGAGDLLFAALALSSATGQCLRLNAGSAQSLRGIGCGVQTSALPLPATATPATTDAAFAPAFLFGVR